MIRMMCEKHVPVHALRSGSPSNVLHSTIVMMHGYDVCVGNHEVTFITHVCVRMLWFKTGRQWFTLRGTYISTLTPAHNIHHSCTC